jgi:cell division protease FtsH
VSKQAAPPPLGDKKAPSAPPSPPRWRHWLWPVALIAFLALWLLLPTLHTNQVTLSYSQFLSKVSAQQVKTVTLGSNGEASGTLKNGTTYNTVIPSQAGQALLDDLQNANVEITASAPGPSFGSEVLTWILLLSPFLLIGWLWTRLSRGAGGQLQGVLGVGRSRAKVFDAERPQTRFSDVAGYEGAKAEIAEVVDFLRNPDRYRRAGATPPRGVLMIGPPGTGKTLIARAVAGEAEVPFFSVAGSSFVELFVGVGAARVGTCSPRPEARAAIIFIDEIDAIGRSRSSGAYSGANDEREQTLNQLLSEMDGFDPAVGIVVIGATNRPEVLDPALLRPGRFDRQITIPLPNLAEREAILKVHCRGKQLDPDVDLQVVARGTPGFSGADLANLVNEAAINAVRGGREVITAEDFDTARTDHSRPPEAQCAASQEKHAVAMPGQVTPWSPRCPHVPTRWRVTIP